MLCSCTLIIIVLKSVYLIIPPLNSYVNICIYICVCIHKYVCTYACACNIYLNHVVVMQIVVPKSDEQRKRLTEAIKHIFLFRALDFVSNYSNLSFPYSWNGYILVTVLFIAR